MMLLPSSLVPFLRRANRSVSYCARHLTHPTLRTPRRALYPSEHRLLNGPSKLACSFPKSSLDQSKRARVKEHRLSENTMVLVCRLPRAQGLTRLISFLLVCALGEQRRRTGHPPPTFASLTQRHVRWHRQNRSLSRP